MSSTAIMWLVIGGVSWILGTIAERKVDKDE